MTCLLMSNDNKRNKNSSVRFNIDCVFNHNNWNIVKRFHLLSGVSKKLYIFKNSPNYF